MSLLQKIFGPILYILRFKKKMIFASLFSAVIFSILFFPYDDLSDYLTELIAKNTQNQVFVQFEKLGIALLPPSIKMTEVSVDTPFLPTLKAGSLNLAPSIAGLLAFNPGFSAVIDNIMKGRISINFHGGKKVNDSIKMQKLTTEASGLDLKKVSNFAGLPVELGGNLFMDVDAQFDPAFAEQPDGEAQIKILKFHLPQSTIPTMMGPTSLPNMELANVLIKGTLRGSNLTIEEAQIGDVTDAVHGRIKGHITMRIVRRGNQITPEFGGYEFKIDLTLDHNAEKDLGIFLSFYDKFKTTTGTGSRYAMKLSSPNIQAPPNASPMGSF